MPAYNEQQTIYRVVKTIINNVQLTTYKQSAIVIDDGSSDNTDMEAKRAGATVLQHIVNRGQGAALQTGTEYAVEQGADIVVHFDADGQHEVNDIEKLIQPIIEKKIDVVLGSRFKLTTNNKPPATSKTRNELLSVVSCLLKSRHIPWHRRLLALGSLILNTLLSGLLLSDVHNGLRAMSRYAAQKIQISQDRMAHNTEYLQEIKHHSLRFTEVPVKVYYDRTLKKSQGLFEGFKILKDLFFGKFSRHG
jgi:polyprenyl-phospho-N-acetylgalactosaminyl synthase